MTPVEALAIMGNTPIIDIAGYILGGIFTILFCGWLAAG